MPRTATLWEQEGALARACTGQAAHMSLLPNAKPCACRMASTASNLRRVQSAHSRLMRSAHAEASCRALMRNTYAGAQVRIRLGVLLSTHMVGVLAGARQCMGCRKRMAWRKAQSMHSVCSACSARSAPCAHARLLQHLPLRGMTNVLPRLWAGTATIARSR